MAFQDVWGKRLERPSLTIKTPSSKAVFWQTHAGIPFSEREQQVLNVYLDGYEGKLTAKNWAKLSKVSLDTAARDIKRLVEAGILIPQPGRVRDVSYGIRCAKDSMMVPGSEQGT